MEDMGLNFTPVIGRCLLGHLSMYGPMAGTSGTQLVQTVLTEGLTRPPASHPPPPPAHPCPITCYQ